MGITLVLFMLGVLLTLEYHSYRLTHDAQERITYKVDLSPDVTDSLALALKAQVEQMEYVKHVDYISKQQAAEIFTEDLGEDFVGFAGYNPLYPSLMVNFNVQLLPDNSSELLDKFCAEVSKQEGVTGVAYQENVVNELREVSGEDYDEHSGFIDKTGKMVIDLNGAQSDCFSDGVAKVWRGEQEVWFIDKTGKRLFDVDTNIIHAISYFVFTQGLAPVQGRGKYAGKYGFMDKKGRITFCLDKE